MKISGIFKSTVYDNELSEVEQFCKQNKLKLFIEKDYLQYNENNGKKYTVYIFLRNFLYDFNNVNIENPVFKELIKDFELVEIGNSRKYKINRSLENMLVLSDSINNLNSQISQIPLMNKDNSDNSTNTKSRKEQQEREPQLQTQNPSSITKKKRGRPKKVRY